MARIGATPFAFPDFHGATRRLVLVNLGAYFLLAIAGLMARRQRDRRLLTCFSTRQRFCMGGYGSPSRTASCIPPACRFHDVRAALDLVPGRFPRDVPQRYWVMGLYAASVVGTALAALGIYGASVRLVHHWLPFRFTGALGGFSGC